MSVLLDTGVIYAYLNKQDPRHDDALEVLRRIASGEMGSPVVSDHVVDELFTLIRRRRQSAEVEQAARRFLPLDGPSRLRLRIVMVGPSGLVPAAKLYRRHHDRRLSFTDATHLVLMQRLSMDRLATFDGGFRGLVPVVPE